MSKDFIIGALVTLLVVAAVYVTVEVAQAPERIAETPEESDTVNETEDDTADTPEEDGETDLNEGDEIPQEPAEPASPQVVDEVTVCTDEMKQAEICTMEYAPVCGLVEVQCVTEPCDPVPETFSNGCVACSQGNVISYTPGQCTR